MKDKAMIALTARMDGERVTAANAGKKHKVSDIELLALCNFAEIGLMSLYASLEGKHGEDARAELDTHLDAIRNRLGRNGKADGLERLSLTCAALLRGEKFGRFLVGAEWPQQ